MLTLYRRHLKDCPHTSRRYRRCACPLWVQGSLAGEKIRKSLDLTSWEAGSDLITQWTSAGQIGGIRKNIPSIESAVTQYLADCEKRLKKPSVKKYRSLLRVHFLPWCESRRLTRLQQLDVTALREFRNSWEFAPITQQKNLEYLRGFCKFCVLSGWLDTNPATPIKGPKVHHVPTLPFSKIEIEKLLTTSKKVNDGVRLRALILLMRYTGFRISDAIKLKRTDVKKGRVFVYQAKTGNPVHVPVPPLVLKALKDVKNDGEFFFWSGTSALMTGIEVMRRKFYDLCQLAGVVNGHFHRLRDTLAVELLVAGVPIDQVSVLLGHSSVRITEKHYAPWVKERQVRLEKAVRSAW